MTERREREKVLELWSIGYPVETIAKITEKHIAKVYKIISQATDNPANFYELLLVKGGHAARSRTIREIKAKPMSRRRRARAIEVVNGAQSSS